MVNELKRHQMIWLIKRASSITAWKRFEESLLKFVKEFEVEIKRSLKPDIHGYKLVLDAQIDLEEGLKKLAQGDKSIFQYRNQFDGCIPDLMEAFGRVFGSNPDQGYDYSNFDELEKLWQQMKWPKILFTKDRRRNEGLDDAFAGFWILDDAWFGPFNFPNELPVPVEPAHDILIQSNERVPEYGIWEPVKILSGPHAAPEHEERLNEWLKKAGHPPPEVPVKYEVDIIGCPNYLLQGTLAPISHLENGDGYRSESPQAVTWRLLWKDDRYLDGTVPEEESFYFVKTKPVSTLGATTGRLRAEPNDLVPKTGWWHSQAKPNGQALHYFEAGQRFPDWHTTQYGSVIWGFNPDEQKEPPKK